MGVRLRVNARNRVVITHTEPFKQTPIWIQYAKDKRQIEILFDSGPPFLIDFNGEDYFHQVLMNTKHVLVMLMEEDRVPLEIREILLAFK